MEAKSLTLGDGDNSYRRSFYPTASGKGGCYHRSVNLSADAIVQTLISGYVKGGASGIGYATAKILASRGAKVFILDLHPPQDDDVPEAIHYEPCDVTVWTELCNVFLSIGPIDMVFSNAGISEVEPLLVDELPADENGLLLEPVYPLIDVILRSALNVIKLSWSIMRKHGREGSIVLTSSSTAYAPELRLPLYSALKLTVSIG